MASSIVSANRCHNSAFFCVSLVSFVGVIACTASELGVYCCACLVQSLFANEGTMYLH